MNINSLNYIQQMKKLIALIAVCCTLSSFTAQPVRPFPVIREITVFSHTVHVDFSGQLPDHSVLVFEGQQGQGCYAFDSHNGTTQHHRLPAFGTYKIKWFLYVAVPESCTVFMNDDAGDELLLQETADGQAELDGVALSDNYSFSVQCREP